MTDVNGNEVQVNDIVFYTLSGRGEDVLYRGKIVELESNGWRVKILTDGSKRIISRRTNGFIKV